jgi:hypothetical protein
VTPAIQRFPIIQKWQKKWGIAKMTKRVAVISPNCTSASAKRLASLIGADYHHADGYDWSKYDLVINYGSSNGGEFKKVINPPTAVKICVNKISTLKRVAHGVEWTKDPEVAKEWLKKDKAVVCRESQTGMKSEGTNIAYTLEGFNDSPATWWSRYFPHDHEVRVNVYKGKILSVYKKVEEEGYFDFKHMEVTGEHRQVNEMIQSISANIGIDLYGMDILVNNKGVAKLLEVNSGAVLLEETEGPLLKLLEKEVL